VRRERAQRRVRASDDVRARHPRERHGPKRRRVKFALERLARIWSFHSTPPQSAPLVVPSDLRRARSGLTNLAPTSTGSATAIALIFPELKGKLNGMAVRVPLLNGSLTDCVFEVARETTVEEVNALMKEASQGWLKGVLGYEEQPLVSTDYINDERSGIVDALSTMVIDKTHLKMYVWYDNEYGYSARMVDIARMIAGKM